MITGKTMCFVLLFSLISYLGLGQSNKPERSFLLQNSQIKLGIELANGHIRAEHFSLFSAKDSIFSDGDFGLEIVWTDWVAPGMNNNGENPVTLSKKDFEIKDFEKIELTDGSQKVEINFQGNSNHLQLRMTYLIEPEKYYVRRKIAIRDTIFSKHLLHKIKAYNTKLNATQPAAILKEGGFGQPVGLQLGDHGFYAGLEYPASTNTLKYNSSSELQITCAQLKGLKISNEWIESDWVVLGLSPDRAVKKWFMDYVDDIKIEPNRPYTLYNSWYDLRGEKYVVGSYVKELHTEDYMTESNVLRLYNLFKTNFTDKYEVGLDAFVLDDGWDVYESDWVLNKNEFPKGLLPLKSTLERNKTSLGMWFGPSGGYSSRMKRINWFRDNDYEVVGEEKQWGGAQLCLAGKNYSRLFKQRTAEFVNQGVSYYKWDGFQFSCSEVDHGHPIGLYSQVSVLDTLLSAIEEIHTINPNVYHSVSSGTWLSPWWLKHASQIWMQGEDYGLADVPSYDAKDAAITYRDLVLYDGLKNKDNWFPISNMMTHGIIKGKLEDLYLDTPLDKFSDNVMLYFARGVSMYELYTSPDVMQPKEWEVVANALKWAKSNFSTLMNTEMIGGDPSEKQAYGYLHLKENQGVIAARNPFIREQDLKVFLGSNFGLDPNATQLVLEKVYPYHWIAPKLYSAGDSLVLPLNGYETAIYEIYPLAEATEPLIAGVPFHLERINDQKFELRYFGEGTPKMLNEKSLSSLVHQNKKISPDNLPKQDQSANAIITGYNSRQEEGKISINYTANPEMKEATFAFLFTSKEDAEIGLPFVTIEGAHESVPVKFNGEFLQDEFEIPIVSAGWYSIPALPGEQSIELKLDKEDWQGDVEVWLIGTEIYSAIDLEINMKKKSQKRGEAPVILKKGTLTERQNLGNIRINY